MQDNSATSESTVGKPPAYVADHVEEGIIEGLYVITHRKSRRILDLCYGSIESNTPCIGWTRNDDGEIDNQLWIVKRAEGAGTYTVMSLRGGTFMDLQAGKREDNSPVVCHSRAWDRDGRLNQEWRICEEMPGHYKLQCVRTETFLDMEIGGTVPEKRVTCCNMTEGHDGQLWDLERVSRTSLEIKGVITSWKPDLLSRIIQPYADHDEYFVIPQRLRNIIWNQTKLLNQPIYKNTFDYDDFVIKAKDAVNTWARDSLRVRGYSILFGIIFGEARQGPKAYNWYLSSDMRSLVFFDAQTGKEYTTAALDHFGFEPTFAMF